MEPESDMDRAILERLIDGGNVLGFGRDAMTMAVSHIQLAVGSAPPQAEKNDQMNDLYSRRDDVVARLRRLGCGFVGTISAAHCPLLNEAADMLELAKFADKTP